jgi:hypothetical protein
MHQYARGPNLLLRHAAVGLRQETHGLKKTSNEIRWNLRHAIVGFAVTEAPACETSVELMTDDKPDEREPYPARGKARHDAGKLPPVRCPRLFRLLHFARPC